MSMQQSAVSQTANFGRAWELTIITQAAEDSDGQSIVVSSSAWDPETLRITFDINMPAYKAVWFAKISIYNLNSATAQQVLTQGSRVILKAGYQSQPLQVIFQGEIYQPMFERENVTDMKLTLMCYTGLKEVIGNFSAFRGSAFASQAALVAKMAASAYQPITVDKIDSTALSQTMLPFPRTFFGDPNKFFDRVARANNMQSWYGFDGINIGAIQQTSAESTITYTPTTGILGTPQQTQDGVQLRVLLDSRLRIQIPPIQIQINNAVIRQLPRYPGSYPSVLDQDGLYLVMGLSFQGDSRSMTTWYTEIVACTSVGGKLAMLADAGNPSTPLDLRAPR